MNKVILSGYLTKDPELRRTTNGTAVASACVAVRRTVKEQDGNYGTDFINLVVWSSQAEFLNNYCKKGDMVELVGRWQTRTYQANDGSNRIVNECVVESLQKISRSKDNEQEPTQESKNDSVSSPYNQSPTSAKNASSLPYPQDKDETPEPTPSYDGFDDSDLPF